MQPEYAIGGIIPFDGTVYRALGQRAGIRTPAQKQQKIRSRKIQQRVEWWVG
jgi:hypothetical protein